MKLPDCNEWIRNSKLCRQWLESYVKRGILKKSNLRSILYLNKSRHNLDFANWIREKHKEEIPRLFGNERFYDWVINAYYYSVYHAALALIAEKGFSSISHNATVCAVIWFYYHQRKVLDKKDIEIIKDSINKEDIDIITKTKDLRERASYDVSSTFESGLSEIARNNAVYFLSKAKTILR